MDKDQLLARISDHIEDQLLDAYYQQQERDYDEEEFVKAVDALVSAVLMVNEEPPYDEDN